MSNSATAKANNSSSTSSRRSKKSQEVNLKSPVAVDSVETSQKPSVNASNGAQVIAMPVPANLKEAAIQTSSQTALTTPLPGNRPIDSSNIQVLGTISAMGERPIVASNIKVWDTITLSGERPIATSSLQLSETAMIMGNRPIASNYLDGAEDIMGYLD